jgi:hypothetical protein
VTETAKSLIKKRSINGPGDCEAAIERGETLVPFDDEEYASTSQTVCGSVQSGIGRNGK